MEPEGSERALVVGLRSTETDRGLASWAAAKADALGVVSALAAEMPDSRASPHSDKSALSLLLCKESRGGSVVRRFDRVLVFVWGLEIAGEGLLELDAVEGSPDDVDTCVLWDPESEESDFEGLCDRGIVTTLSVGEG